MLSKQLAQNMPQEEFFIPAGRLSTTQKITYQELGYALFQRKYLYLCKKL